MSPSLKIWVADMATLPLRFKNENEESCHHRRVGLLRRRTWCGCCLNHPHAELVAVTSRQNAGQTLAQVFPKFASHPKSKTLRFSEPNAELLAKQADVVFLALPHGVAAEYAVPLLNAGCVVIDLSADFRLKSAEIYKEFYAHDHPAPDLLKKSVYGLPEIYRGQIKKSSAHRVAGLLSDRHFTAAHSAVEGGTDQVGRHHRRFLERRQRGGTEGRDGLSFLRMQRKCPALRRAKAPAFVGNRRTTFAGGRVQRSRSSSHRI